jgi:hypothetical protein
MSARGTDTAKALADGDFDRALEAAIEFGMIEGAKDERARIASILRSAEAQTCVGTAILLAIHESAMTLQHVRDILGHVPVIDAPTTNVIDVAARRAALKLIDQKR